MDPRSHPELTVALALAVGIMAQSVSRLLRLPGIVLLLAAGALLGPEGAGWIHPRALGEGLFGIIDFGVAIILFEGGLNLEWSRLKRQETAIRRLITWGALVTLVGATALAWLVLGWRWHLAILFGALVVVTGPTVVQPLLRDLRLRPRLKTILEAEGVLIDPIGALLAGSILQLVTVPGVGTLASETAGVAVSIGFGLLSGLAAGFLLAGALRFRLLIAHGYENVLTLASVVLLFEACDTVTAPSGVVAVTVAGIVMGNLDTRVGRDLREFKDQLTVLLVGMLFILLAADVAIDEVRALGWRGLAVVVRPLGVWLTTRRLQLTTRERVFIGAIAPRGIVAAAIASITASTLESQGLEGGAGPGTAAGGCPARGGRGGLVHRVGPETVAGRRAGGSHRAVRRPARRPDDAARPDGAGRHRHRPHVQRTRQQPVREGGARGVRRRSRLCRDGVVRGPAHTASGQTVRAGDPVRRSS